MKKIVNLLLGLSLLIPHVSQAQMVLVPGDDLSICDIFPVMENVFTFLLLTLSSVVILTIVIGGIKMVISSGNPSVFNEGIKLIQNGIVGFLMVSGAMILLFSFLKILGVGNTFGNLVKINTSSFEIICEQSGPIGPEDGGGEVDLGLLVKPKSGGGDDGGGGNDGGDPGGGGLPGDGVNGIAQLAMCGYSPELRAFMRALSYTEGVSDAEGYYRGFGGTMFNGVVTHPGVSNPNLHNENKARFGYNSDAFGRYQMISTTWNEWAAAANIPKNPDGTYNISPANQDIAVAEYLQRQGIEEQLQAGDVEGAAASLGAVWTSVPGGSQPNSRTPEFFDIYDQLLEEEKANPSTC